MRNPAPLFYSGKAAMLMTGTWLLTELNEMIPGLYDFGPHPGLKEGQDSVIGSPAAVPWDQRCD